MYYLFLDTETIGLDPLKNPIIQISGIICKDSKVIEKFNFKCRPFKGDMICESDLEFHAERGITKEMIENYEQPQDVYVKFVSLLDKYVNRYDKTKKFKLLGYNVKFDTDFMNNFFHVRLRTVYTEFAEVG